MAKRANLIFSIAVTFVIFIAVLAVITTMLYSKPPQQVIVSPEKDYRVLYDPLQSPTNRSDSSTESHLRHEVEMRNFYVNTRPSYDTFRIIGYLTNTDPEKDAGGNSWKLFARERDRNRAEFYIIPANNNYDIKLMIKDDMTSPRLRDIYSIPDMIVFNHPMMNKTAYTFVENPKESYL